MDKKYQIAIIGPAGAEEYPAGARPDDRVYELAYEVGGLLVERGCIVVTGGKSGVMEEAARGAKDAKGTTVGVVSGKERFTSNPYIDVEVVTGADAPGLDEYNIVVMSDVVIMVGGGAGTLQEAVLAYRNTKPVVAISDTGGWADQLPTFLDERKKIEIVKVASAKEAVEAAVTAASSHAENSS